MRRPFPEFFLGASLVALALLPAARAWSLAPDLAHGWMAALLAAFLWWDSRELCPRFWRENARLENDASPSPRLFAWGALAIVLALVATTRLLLTPYPLWPVPLWLYCGGVFGLIVLIARGLGGAPLALWVAAPLVIFLGALPWPGVIDRSFILPLRELLAVIVAELNNLAGRPAEAVGTNVRLASGWVGIDEACGGMRSIQSSITAALFFGAWLRFSLARRLGLVAAALGAAVAGNLARVWTLSWAAGSSAEALDRWHDPAGWLALGASLAATGALAAWWHRGATPQPMTKTAAHNAPPPPAAPWLRWGAVALLAIVTIEVGARGWYARGAARIEAVAGSWEFALPKDAPGWTPRTLSDNERKVLQPHRYQAGAWRGPEGGLRAAHVIEWREGQAARSVPFLHNPESCLPYTGAEPLGELAGFELPVPGGGNPARFRVHRFRLMGEEITVAFCLWDAARGQELTPPERAGASGWWRHRLRDVREARAEQPAFLFAYVVGGRADRDLFAKEIAPLMQAGR